MRRESYVGHPHKSMELQWDTGRLADPAKQKGTAEAVP